MIFQCINIRQVPREVLKTGGLGFQHLPRDLANVNAWKTMFDPYIENLHVKWCSPFTSTVSAHHIYENILKVMRYILILTISLFKVCGYVDALLQLNAI